MGLVPNKAFLFCRLVHEKRPQASWSLQLLFKHHPHNACWFAGHLVCRGVQKVRLRVLFWPQDWADPQAALICRSLKMGCKTSPAAPHFLQESLKSCTDPVGQSDPQSCGSLGFTADVSWTRGVYSQIWIDRLTCWTNYIFSLYPLLFNLKSPNKRTKKSVVLNICSLKSASLF